MKIVGALLVPGALVGKHWSRAIEIEIEISRSVEMSVFEMSRSRVSIETTLRQIKTPRLKHTGKQTVF